MALEHLPADPARVALRVLHASGSRIRLEVAVQEAIDAGAKLIAIRGCPFSKRSLAIEYLRAAAPHLADHLINGAPNLYVVQSAAQTHAPIIFEHFGPCSVQGVTNLRLAPWGSDECIEWAIGLRNSERAAFVQRASAMVDLGFSTPHILASVWQLMEQHPEIASIESAIQRLVMESLPDEPMRHAAFNVAFGVATKSLMPVQPIGLLNERLVQRLLGAEHVVHALAQCDFEAIRRMLPADLSADIASRLRTAPKAMDALKFAVDHLYRQISAACAVSLLVLAKSDWRPQPKLVYDLSGARLANAPWPNAQLVWAILQRCDLSDANLADADLSRADLVDTCCARANLARARLAHAKLMRTDCRYANLCRATLTDASCSDTMFNSADLASVDAARAAMFSCRFDAASLRNANLEEARFSHCTMTDADLSGAICIGARLVGLDLRTARLHDVNLDDAKLQDGQLAQIAASGLRAQGARFTSCDLTGSVLRGATFARATFKNCGLAEIWWEGADLRDVDFSGSTFHMGSSRCGLVGSPIASEGTRTGFYTDDHAEQDYRPPEDIAKADLRGSDLRGAKVEGIDFYLVDLRGAVYDPAQAEWFKKCGAILYARV